MKLGDVKCKFNSDTIEYGPYATIEVGDLILTRKQRLKFDVPPEHEVRPAVTKGFIDTAIFKHIFVCRDVYAD